MKHYIKLVKEFNDTSKGGPAEAFERIVLLPADLIYALILRIKYRKAFA